MPRTTLPLERITVLALLVLAPAPAIAQTLQAPDGWIARPERFVEMPPGFHITAGRGVILYHPAATARGEFRVESEGFLFDPLGADGTYGLIVALPQGQQPPSLTASHGVLLPVSHPQHDPPPT